MKRNVTLFFDFTQWAKIIVIFTITLLLECTLYTKSACIIVHGTWAKNASWYRPSGEFFEMIKRSNNELGVVDDILSFTWSGKLGYSAQLQAAYELVEMINQYDFVILIAHSHGSTVGMIASQVIFEKFSNCDTFSKIKKFYSLGVPVNTSIAKPNMHVIYKFYNLFSFGDMIQTVNGVYNRVFPQEGRVYNLSVELSGKSPGHTQLHDVILACSMLYIDEHYKQNVQNGFDLFDNQPGKIAFYQNKLPEYSYLHDLDDLLKVDKQAHALSTLAFFRASNLTRKSSQFVDYEAQ